MWVENLRVLKELMRYDEEYIYLNNMPLKIDF